MGFLQDFLRHNEGNEIPKRYLVWSAYGALSAVIGRRVFVDLGHFIVVPNIYSILVGKAGGRKTSSRDKAHDLVYEAIPSTVFSGDNDTYQGIVTAMERDDSRVLYTDHTGQQSFYRPYCIFSPEFPDYLQNNPLGMIAFLTNIYDRRHYLYRLKNEDRTLTYPYVMMLACAPPDWLADQVKAKQFAAGYGRRTILVCNLEYIRKKPVLDEEAKRCWARCVKRLVEIQKIVGPMIIEPDAEKWFWDWYLHPPKMPDDPFLEAWRESWHINLIKVAILISLSERDDRVITLNYMQLALEQLLDIEANLPMITSKIGRSEVAEPVQRVLDIVRHNGGFIQEKLLKLKSLTVFKDTREQWSTIEWLKQQDQLIIVPRDGKTYLALPEAVKITKKNEPNQEAKPTDTKDEGTEEAK